MDRFYFYSVHASREQKRPETTARISAHATPEPSLDVDLRPSDDDVTLRSRASSMSNMGDGRSVARKCLESLGCCPQRPESDDDVIRPVRVNRRGQELILLDDWGGSGSGRHRQPTRDSRADRTAQEDEDDKTGSGAVTTLSTMIEYIRSKLHQSYDTMTEGSTKSHANVTEADPTSYDDGQGLSTTGSGSTTMRSSKSESSVMTSQTSGVTSVGPPVVSAQTKQVRSSGDDSFEVIDLNDDSNTESHSKT